MLAAITMWNKPMLFLFMGAILGSIPPLYRKVKVSRIKPANVLVALIGAVIGVCSMYLPEGVFQMTAVLICITFPCLWLPVLFLRWL
jgi:putative membrane protein